MQVLSDAQWAEFEVTMTAAKIHGARPRVQDRRTVDAIIWRLDNGAKCRSPVAQLVAEGERQPTFACVDGTIAHAHDKACGARTGKDPSCVCDPCAVSLTLVKRLAAHEAIFSASATGL